MEIRELEWTLFLLETEKNELITELMSVKGMLKQKLLSTDDRAGLLEEKEELCYEIRECELDIAIYTEMLNALSTSEIGRCGFPCDGNCQACGGTESYDPRFEVFTGGDY